MVTPVSALPSTSSAVNIQIIEPKNFVGSGADPGTIARNGQVVQPQQTGVTNAVPQPGIPAAPLPYGQLPQQQLQDMYQRALDARNAAEQARNEYLNFANQANSQAYQQQQTQPQYPGYPAPVQVQPQINQPINQPYMPAGQLPSSYVNPAMTQYQQPFVPGMYPPPPAVPGQPPVDPMQAYMQQQQALQQQQAMQQQWPQQTMPTPAGAEQAQQMQQPEAQQAQQQPETPQDPDDVSGFPVDQLNNIIANPQSLQQKVNALEELGIQGQGTPDTYELLKQEAMTDTSQLTGQQKDEADYIRQAALWTLGMLNKAQNGQVPSDSLPGMPTIAQIINNKNENPDVKAAAVQSLQVLDRPTDPTVAKLLKKASKDRNPEVSDLAKQALAGQGIPLGAPQTAFEGVDPSMLADPSMAAQGAPQLAMLA